MKKKPVLQSVLERIAARKIKLKEYGENPKRILLWLGWRVAQFTKPKWNAVEERSELGRKIMVRVYNETWWASWGDRYLDKQLAGLKKHPQWLDNGRVPGDKK